MLSIVVDSECSCVYCLPFHAVIYSRFGKNARVGSHGELRSVMERICNSLKYITVEMDIEPPCLVNRNHLVSCSFPSVIFRVVQKKWTTMQSVNVICVNS